MSSIVLLAIVAGIFYILSRGFLNNPSINEINLEQKQAFSGDLRENEAGLIISLLAKVAKADGRVSELEAELIKHSLSDISNAFSNSVEVRKELKTIYNEEKDHFDNTLDICEKYYSLTRFAYQKRLWVMEYLLNLAFIDGEYSSHEEMITEDITNALHVKKEDFDTIIDRFRSYYASKQEAQGVSLDEAYEILGADKKDEFASIKRKYRALVKKNHPDILMGQGKSENIINEATAKLQKINEAYELVKKDKAI